jgi:hypothetical protein
VRTELVFEINTVCPSVFSRGRNTHFVPNRPIHLMNKHMYLSKEKHLHRKVEHVANYFPVTT